MTEPEIVCGKTIRIRIDPKFRMRCTLPAGHPGPCAAQMQMSFGMARALDAHRKEAGCHSTDAAR